MKNFKQSKISILVTFIIAIIAIVCCAMFLKKDNKETASEDVSSYYEENEEDEFYDDEDSEDDEFYDDEDDEDDDFYDDENDENDDFYDDDDNDEGVDYDKDGDGKFDMSYYYDRPDEEIVFKPEYEETINIEKTAPVLLPDYNSELIQDLGYYQVMETYSQADVTLDYQLAVFEDGFVPIDKSQTTLTFLIPPIQDGSGYLEVTFPFDGMNYIKSEYNKNNDCSQIYAWYGNPKEAHTISTQGYTYIDPIHFFDDSKYSSYAEHLDRERFWDLQRQYDYNNIEEDDDYSVPVDTSLHEIKVNENDCYYSFKTHIGNHFMYLDGGVNCNGRFVEFHVYPDMTPQESIDNMEETYQRTVERFKYLAGSLVYHEQPSGDELSVTDVPNMSLTEE